MQSNSNSRMVITDGSRLIIEALARAGAAAFIGYPITPANLLYSYAAARIPIMLPAPDEITTVQWMAGLSAGGKIPVTATSFPGYALMIESINMAFMMELPMVIILVQRLGPATGTATCGAQGDLLCRVTVETPVNLTAKQRELMQEFEATFEGEEGAKHSPKSSSFFDGVKSFLDRIIS